MNLSKWKYVKGSQPSGVGMAIENSKEFDIFSQHEFQSNKVIQIEMACSSLFSIVVVNTIIN